MGVFNFFKKRQAENLPVDPVEEQFADISEAADATTGVREPDCGLQAIYNYASFDFEHRGYQDAITNPDSSYKNENLNLLLEDLNIKIRQAKTYYNELLKKIDFHVSSRREAGLIDIVNELLTRKSIVEQRYDEVVTIAAETAASIGLVSRITLSYNRGFNKGLASISNDLLKTDN